jgi:hypothetical protein
VSQLDGVQIPALHVLHDGELEPVGRCHVGDDGRDRFAPGELARPEAALAHHQLVARACSPHDDGLQNAVLLDRSRELAERGFIELAAGLLGIRIDQSDLDLLRSGRRLAFCRVTQFCVNTIQCLRPGPRRPLLSLGFLGLRARDQGSETSTQGVAALTHVLPPSTA